MIVICTEFECEGVLSVCPQDRFCLKVVRWKWYTRVRVFFFQAEDGIRDLVRSRGLGDVYKRQPWANWVAKVSPLPANQLPAAVNKAFTQFPTDFTHCLLYTSDAADERSSVDLGGRRIIKKKKYDQVLLRSRRHTQYQKH